MATAAISVDTVRDRLARLLEQCNDVVATRRRSEYSNQEFVDAALFREWRVGCLAFLEEAFGTDSPYHMEYAGSCDSPYLTAVARGLGVLRAAHEYVGFGPVARVEELVAAEIFGDLLGFAQRTLGQGDAAGAATLGLAVLEDVLYRQARSRRLELREGVDDLAAINEKLARGGIYPPTVRKRIEAWAALARGGHGESRVGDANLEVAAMLKGIRDFINDYLV